MRNTDHRTRRVRTREQPTYQKVSPHDFPGADVRPAPDGKVLVTAPYREYFERWAYYTVDPDGYQYVYRIEQLQGINDTTILVIGGGNLQLLTPEFAVLARHSNITLKEIEE